MTLAERAPRAPRLPAPPPAAVGVRLAGWGGGPAVSAQAVSPASVEELQEAVASFRPAALARGLGRSYGDAAQLAGGLVVDVRRLRRFELDPVAGTVTAEAGASLGELLDALAGSGWVLPVVPGTQHVTVGGAIACDIHGKNHGTAGTFGRHVQALGLVCADGSLRELGPADDLFLATVGGMGLTGVIAWTRIALAPLPAPVLSVDSERVGSLDGALAALLAPGGPHRVAWLDLLSSRPVRGVVTRAAPAEAPETAAVRGGWATVAARARVPAWWPGGLLRPGVVRAYNDYRYRRSPGREQGRLESFGAHMFPLDALERWPRLYGRAGFVQYQLVVPRGAERALEEVLVRLRGSRVPCYLAVLKDFGPAGPAPLSFPLEGWTLALDLPRAADGLWQLLDGFDQVVAGAGGRVYLAKDARLHSEVVAEMYPRLGEWRTVRDAADPEGRWRSDLALRTGLVEARG